MHRVGFIVPQGFQLMSLAALTAFEIANLPPAGPCYDVHLLSEHGGPVRSSGGMTVETEAFGDPAFDTVIAGSITALEIAPSDASLITFVQVDHRHCRPAANETMLGLRRAVGTEVVHWLGANKPAYKA